MTRINTNLVSLTAQHNLYNNQISLQTSLERLSTGLRINSGKDDPSGLIASSVFGSEVVTVGQAITNSQRANNIVATADAALAQVSTLLNDIRGLVQASANKGALSSSEIAANQVQVDSAIDSIDRIGQTTVFGGDLLLNGSKSFNVAGNLGSVFNSASDIQVSSFDPALHTATPYDDVKLQINQSATKSQVNLVGTGNVAGAGFGLSNLSLGTSTRTTDTLTTNSYNVGANTSLNDLSTTSTRTTRTITGATITGLAADGGSTIDFTITGNLGSKTLTAQPLAGANGIETLSNFASLINANASSTGVTASVSGGNIVLKSSFVGANSTANVSFANYSGSHSSSVINTSDFHTFTGSGAGSLTFKVTGSVGNVTISADASQVAASGGATYLEGLINAQTGATGVNATIDSNGNILLTNSAAVGNTSPAFVSNVTANVAGDGTAFTADANTSQFTGTAADAAAGTANGAVGAATVGTSGTNSGRTITGATISALVADSASAIDFTITGNTGNATVSSQLLAGGTGIETLSNFATLINNKTSSTGVTATVSGGNVVLSSTTGGPGGLANLTFANYTGAHSSSVINTADFGTFTGSGAGSLTFNLTGSTGTANISADASTVKAAGGVTYLEGLINAKTANTGITATTDGSGNILLTNTAAVGTTSPAFVSTIVGVDSAKFTADSNTSQFTGAAADATAATANGAVGALTTGSDVAGSTIFTITGNRGTATINTASLSTTVGGNTYTGNDAIINNASNSGANALATLINTRTASTGVTASVDSNGNVVLNSGNVGTGSLASITAGGTDAALTSAGGAANAVAGISGSSNTTTLQLTGDLGNAVITINNDAVINDSGALVSAINAVTGQTGITATGSGSGANVVLSSQSYGSTAKAAIQAISASNSADISLINSSNTQQSTTGIDAQGTVTDGRGSGQFTAQGALISYTDGGLSFTANSAPTLAQPTAYTTTISGSVFGSLTTSTAQDTLKFHVVGTKGQADVTVNAQALQGDSRVLSDAINSVSLTTGVTASTTANAAGSFAGQNIVVTAAQPGATGTASIQAVTGGTAPASDLTLFNAGSTFTNTTAGTNAPSSAVASFDVTGGALFQIGPQVNFQNQVDANITALDTHLLGRNSSTTGDLGLHDLRTGGSQVLSNDDLTNAAAIVDQAISQIATLRGQLGALQANVLESNISSQQTALEQVTSAQSSIQDADFATETANLTRAQVLVQAGTSVLAIANQQPQSVLALLPRS